MHGQAKQHFMLQSSMVVTSSTGQVKRVKNKLTSSRESGSPIFVRDRLALIISLTRMLGNSRMDRHILPDTSDHDDDPSRVRRHAFWGCFCSFFSLPYFDYDLRNSLDYWDDSYDVPSYDPHSSLLQQDRD